MENADLRALVEAWDIRARARRDFDATLGLLPEEHAGGATAYWATAAWLLASEAELEERIEALRARLCVESGR